MDTKEYVQKVFNEAKKDMRTYFTSLHPADANHFEEFQLIYDNHTYSLQLFVKDKSHIYTELDRWNDFNLTKFKQLITIANKFSKSEDKFELWEVIPIRLSMIL